MPRSLSYDDFIGLNDSFFGIRFDYEWRYNMNADPLFRLKAKTQQDMRELPPEERFSSTLSADDFFGSSDIAILTHEFKANQSDYHGHNFIEINYVVSGICRQNLDREQQVTLNRGNVCIMNPMARHSCSIDSENDIVVNLLMRPELFNTAFFSFFSSNTLIGRFFLNYIMADTVENYLLFRTPYDPYTDFLVERIILEYLSDNPYAQNNIRNLLNLFFSELLRHSLSDSQAPLSRIEEIINYIADHLGNISLNNVAGHFYMHPNYLSSYIKKHTGRTFAEILSEYRLAQAKHLLTSTVLTTEEISSLLGYSEPLSFHNMFRRQTGTTPSQFRKKRGMPGKSTMDSPKSAAV